MRAKTGLVGFLVLCVALAGCSRLDNSKRLRIITWSDYVPADVAADFETETGIHVELTLSNNEEMISKLHATGGAGYDLAQPSVDRITGVEREFGLYKPIDLSQIKLEQFRPEILKIARQIATLDGKLYALPYLWGSEGLVVNSKYATIADYGDLCRVDLKGKTSMRLRRPTLMAFAFALGKDPFALYDKPKEYEALMEDVGRTLADVQIQRAILLRQPRSAVEQPAGRRSRCRHDVGYGRLDTQPGKSRYSLCRAEIRGARLARHLRVAL